MEQVAHKPPKLTVSGVTRVKEILGWYAGENPGVLTNLARMLNHGTLAQSGKMVILFHESSFEPTREN